MKTLLAGLLFVFAINAKAQITFEHAYDSTATWNFCLGSASQLLMVKFEQSGERYIRINRCGNYIKLYDLNHALVKTINTSGLQKDGYNVLGSFLYFSENLFNTDSKMEFMYVVETGSFYKTSIYNEDGLVLFSDTGAALVIPNFEQQQFPIYNTSQGTKMILSYANSQAKVFGLGGTLATSIKPNGNFPSPTNSNLSNPSPNPSSSHTRIDYALPKDVSEADLIFYNIQGIEVKRFKVDGSFDHLLVSTTDLIAGTYYYQLQISGQTGAAKKMVVIH